MYKWATRLAIDELELVVGNTIKLAIIPNRQGNQILVKYWKRDYQWSFNLYSIWFYHNPEFKCHFHFFSFCVYLLFKENRMLHFCILKGSTLHYFSLQFKIEYIPYISLKTYSIPPILLKFTRSFMYLRNFNLIPSIPLPLHFPSFHY